MNDLWRLPTTLMVGGQAYKIHGDFRDILEIFSYFQNESLPPFIRWQIALELFYDGTIPPAHQQEAMEKLAAFIQCGQTPNPGPVLIDWQKDAPLMVADINRTAGQEIRALPFVHWWTFLSWFHGIGEGQFSTVVALREKLRRGKQLEPWEKEFYQKNKTLVDLPKQETAELQAEKARLLALLGR